MADRLEKGRTPDGWDDKPNMKRQKDEDARWIKKHGKSHYGYKNHINVDKEHKLIRGSRVQMLRSGDPVGVKGL